MTSTATIPQKSEVTAYDIVTDPPPADVDPAALPALVDPLRFFNHRFVFVELVIEAPFPTTSTTIDEAAVLATTADGVVDEDAEATAAPKLPAPPNEIDPPTMLVAAAERVTATVFAPSVGPIRPNSSV